MAGPVLLANTSDQQFLAAIVDRLDRVLAVLEPPAPAPDAGPVEIREPIERPAARSTARGRRTAKGGARGDDSPAR